MIIGCAAVLVLSSLLPQPKQVVVWSVADSALDVRQGDRFIVVVRAAIAAGWHVYGIGQPDGGPIALALRVTPAGEFERSGPIAAPAPELVPDPVRAVTDQWYSGAVALRVPLRDVAGRLGARELLVHVRYQACTVRVCLPPAEVTLHVPVRVLRR